VAKKITDKMRLDWLERVAPGVYVTVRAAIDAAIRAEWKAKREGREGQ